jgi:hypothetical protein
MTKLKFEQKIDAESLTKDLGAELVGQKTELLDIFSVRNRLKEIVSRKNMKAFNKELVLCDESQVDEFGYTPGAVVYAYEGELLITVEQDREDKCYCIFITRGSDDGYKDYDVENDSRYDDLEEAQKDLLEELDRQIKTLQQIRDALTEE